jgi:hypothetical protein
LLVDEYGDLVDEESSDEEGDKPEGEPMEENPYENVKLQGMLFVFLSSSIKPSY